MDDLKGLHRVIIEMGMGNDLHGMDYMKAAKRALTAVLPRGKASVTAVQGGLNVPSGGETIVIAQASVEAFLPPQRGWRIRD